VTSSTTQAAKSPRSLGTQDVSSAWMSPTRTDQWDAAVDATLTRFRRFDALVNNAGIVKIGQLRGSSVAHWQHVTDINLTGAYFGMRAVVESTITGGGGSIVNISSVEGLAGSAHLHAYVAAKFGLRGITKSTTVELAPHGIRVNSIHPGRVLTPMSKGVTEDFMAAIPMCRGAEPERKLHVRGVFGQMSRRTPPERNSSSTVA
jgi:3alpha(or 20beta)-hydroxysteroid dehydrogenase